MTAEEVAPPGVDISTPSIARVYDFMVGGKDNFAVDRMVAQRVLEIAPDGLEAGRACRALLRRAVRHLAAEAGIRQFLDIGSGLPTETNVHQVAHEVDPAARVVYVDNDPSVLVHGRALLAGDDTSALIEADIRSPETILAHPVVREKLDFTRPIGLLLFSVLHHLHDAEDPGGIAATLRDALPPGSHLAITHFWDPAEEHPETSARVRESERVFNEGLGTGRWRRRVEIEAFFGDFELIEPGLVPLAEWRPDGEAVAEQKETYYTMLAGVARKR
ncbi:SAM-dependent methyltransferase [Micromonospora luteifusca]|uniref:SAM-dependent methyltransferase n=1 Tax=Micromonospora luteifusca TaxID=709860 RepID=A0ABS2LMD4_9ACTN|nr:SAM-dependent methyltransferase [Micromonospora luteifusca]MBM7489345.1 SAM-dependent methyltransferase [Micromonospora luteifusca]